MRALPGSQNLLDRGERLLRLGQPREAAALARAVLSRRRCDSGALHLAGLAAAMEGNLVSSSKLLARAIAREPGRATWFADLAAVLFTQGRLVEAEEQSLNALSLDAKCEVAHDVMAEIAARQGHDCRAHKHTLTLARLRPDDRKILSRLAIAEYAVGNIPNAIRLMRRLISRKEI